MLEQAVIFIEQDISSILRIQDGIL